MSNPSGPDPDAIRADEQPTDPGIRSANQADEQPTDPGIRSADEAPEPAQVLSPVQPNQPDQPTQVLRPVQPNQPDQATQVLSPVQPNQPTQVLSPVNQPTEVLSTVNQPTEVLSTVEATEATQRRYTAPSGFDAGSTVKIERPPEPATEVINVPNAPPAAQPPLQPPPPQPSPTAPQAFPAQPEVQKRRYRSWGWVLAVVLVIAALAAVTILGTVWLTRKAGPKVSQEDLVKETILDFDTAIQRGDLASLRGITCGANRDTYVDYDDRAWADIHARVVAAKRYPIVASIDQVVVNGEHAEANVTTFMAYDPQIRSTRSFDLQFRDGQWKICQSPTG